MAVFIKEILGMDRWMAKLIIRAVMEISFKASLVLGSRSDQARSGMLMGYSLKGFLLIFRW